MFCSALLTSLVALSFLNSLRRCQYISCTREPKLDTIPWTGLTSAEQKGRITPRACRLHFYELQHRTFMGFFDTRAYCWIMDNLLSTKTPRSRYYISHHFWNYSEHLISHFWQALIFQKTLLYTKYLKSSSFSLQLKISPKRAEDQAFKPVLIFNVRKLSNSIYLNEQVSPRV